MNPVYHCEINVFPFIMWTFFYHTLLSTDASLGTVDIGYLLCSKGEMMVELGC